MPRSLKAISHLSRSRRLQINSSLEKARDAYAQKRKWNDDVVFAGRRRQVRDGASPVFAVLTSDFRLGGAFDGEGQAARAGVFFSDERASSEINIGTRKERANGCYFSKQYE